MFKVAKAGRTEGSRSQKEGDTSKWAWPDIGIGFPSRNLHVELSRSQEERGWIPEQKFLSWFSPTCTQFLQLCLTLCNPMDCSLPGSSVHGDSPGKNIGVGCHALLQGIFSTQGSKSCLLWLLHCRWILYRWTTGEAGRQKWSSGLTKEENPG